MHASLVRDAVRGGTLTTSIRSQNIPPDVDAFVRTIDSAVCFDAGEIGGVSGPFIGDQVRLPYPVCWIEFHAAEGRWTGIQVAAREAPGALEFAMYNPGTTGPALHAVWTVEVVGRGEMRAAIPATVHPDAAAAAQAFSGLVAGFLTALNCKNVVQVEHHPPEKVQAKRRKNGKLPLFSYWTLELALPNTARARQLRGEGEHASPRVHLRRGHPRQYAPGKYCWVQPCTVGNPRLGMAHKDYAVTPAASSPTPPPAESSTPA